MKATWLQIKAQLQLRQHELADFMLINRNTLGMALGRNYQLPEPAHTCLRLLEETLRQLPPTAVAEQAAAVAATLPRRYAAQREALRKGLLHEHTRLQREHDRLLPGYHCALRRAHVLRQMQQTLPTTLQQYAYHLDWLNLQERKAHQKAQELAWQLQQLQIRLAGIAAQIQGITNNN